MDACGAALPEFDSFWVDAVASPEGWEGDFGGVEALFEVGELLGEGVAGGDDFGLVGDPCAELGFAGAGGEVGGGFFWGDFVGFSADGDLALHGEPWEEEGDGWV